MKFIQQKRNKAAEKQSNAVFRMNFDLMEKRNAKTANNSRVNTPRTLKDVGETAQAISARVIEK